MNLIHTLVCAGALLVLASPLAGQSSVPTKPEKESSLLLPAGHVVIFMEGSQIEVQGYELHGKLLLLTSSDGKLYSVPRSYVDLKATERKNGAQASSTPAEAGLTRARTPARVSAKPNLLSDEPISNLHGRSSPNPPTRIPLPVAVEEDNSVDLGATSLLGGPPRPEPREVLARDSDERVTMRVDPNAIDPQTYVAVAVRLPKERAPRIDGRLDDDEWNLAPPSGNFVQREPDFGAPSTERTEFRILYDDRMIYIGVWAFDRNAHRIRASEMKRDSKMLKGDYIRINIDTFHDHRNAYQFGTNPLGARKDVRSVQDGRILNYDWNAIWKSETHVDENGWYAEIAIPLSQLQLKEVPGETTWGLNVARVINHKTEETYWVPFPREWQSIGFQRMSHAGVLRGLRDLRPPRRLELMPFVAPRIDRHYDSATTLSRREMGYGFDFRFGITSNLLANLTYKTDFAQVEADQEVVNLTRFSLFFPEKREFFTESASIFDYGLASGLGGGPGLLPLFYSRRIGLHDNREVPLLGGVKVTGRVGPNTLGFMNIETDPTLYHTSDGDEVHLPRANYTALRVKRDILAKSTVGAVFLNREGGIGAAFNRAVGLDINLSLGRKFNMTGMLAKTFSPGTSGKDQAGTIDLSWKNDLFTFGATYVDIAERFNAEMGFIRRLDIRNPKVRASWTPRPKWRGVRQLTFSGNVEYFVNHAGRVESRNHGLDFRLQRQDNSSVRLSVDNYYDFLPYNWKTGAGLIPLGGYTWDTYGASFNTNRSSRVSGSGSIAWGGYYNGDKRTYRGGLNLLPLETLLVETSYTRNEIKLPARPKYVTNTLSSRFSYSFSPDLFFKTFFQFNDERRLASLNVLLWYIYRPGSHLYVVYNEGWETDLPGPRDLRVLNRSLAIKMTYWLSR